MSWRTWLGEDRQEWADWNRVDFPSLEALAGEIMWKLPCKIYAPDETLIPALLRILDDQYHMGLDDISVFIGSPGEWKDYENDNT